MYNSSKKGKGQILKFDKQKEIAGKIFYNDMSKIYMIKPFYECDAVFADAAWRYGYDIFKKRSDNNSASYKDYVTNFDKMINELKVPAFVTGSKTICRYLHNAIMVTPFILDVGPNLGDCVLYVWNYKYENEGNGKASILLDFLARRFNKVLDFSCGYGEHLLKFKDFVACDIDRNCLTYLVEKYNEKVGINGKTKN